MGLSTLPELWFFLATLPFVVWIAWGDMRWMKITNRSVIALFALFVVLGIFLLPFGDYGFRLLQFAIALTFTFVLNAAGAMGGGDAKLIAVIAPFINPADWGGMALIIPSVILGAYVTHRLIRMIKPLREATAHWVSWTSGRRFPMGLALVGILTVYLGLSSYYGLVYA